jgi:hypothetical protein
MPVRCPQPIDTPSHHPGRVPVRIVSPTAIGELIPGRVAGAPQRREVRAPCPSGRVWGSLPAATASATPVQIAGSPPPARSVGNAARGKREARFTERPAGCRAHFLKFSATGTAPCGSPRPGSPRRSRRGLVLRWRRRDLLAAIRFARAGYRPGEGRAPAPLRRLRGPARTLPRCRHSAPALRSSRSGQTTDRGVDNASAGGSTRRASTARIRSSKRANASATTEDKWSIGGSMQADRLRFRERGIQSGRLHRPRGAVRVLHPDLHPRRL